MNRRYGYTLIELIVVVGIVAILLGLLLPAVQKVRSAAASAKCRNNLKQVALASHSYHDVNGRLPSAFRTGVKRTSTPYLQWPTVLSPFLELDTAWRDAEAEYARSRNPFRAFPAHAGMDRVMPIFACPADARIDTPWTVNSRGKKYHVTLSSYLANSGSRTVLKDGVVYVNSEMRFVSILDGMSNTLLFGERPPSADLKFGWLYASVGQDGTGSLDSVIGVLDRNMGESGYAVCGPGPFHFADKRVQDPCAAFQYWSLHTGGANFAFCDGSVRLLTYAADSVLPALATRAGGEVVEIP